MKRASAPGFSALLEQLFEDAPLPLAIIDVRGEVLHRNAAQQAFNAALGAQLGIGEFNSLDDLRSVGRGHTAQFKRALSFESVEYELSLPAVAANGESEALLFQRLLIPVGVIEAQPAVVVSVLVDISERRRGELEQERLNNQLLHAQKLESLGVLAGGIAHDFNNLLTGVLGNADVALRRIGTHNELRGPLTAIQTAAKRAADVAQRMLAYTGKVRVEKRRVDLGELVSESADLLRVPVAGRLEFSCELAAELPAIEADPTQLQQVVLNLITNACEAMEGRRGRVLLRTGAAQLSGSELLASYHGPGVAPGRFVYVEVQDEGHGMDTATQRRIFDPFFSTKFEGRGLGLSSVLGIVRGHGGAICVSSELQRGTTFRVLFPALQGRAEAAHEQVPALPQLPTPLCVLVIDDESVVRQTAQVMLEELGCRTLTASSGEAGLALYKSQRAEIDCVLVDLTMPGLDGAETLLALREIEPTLRAAIMSGYDSQETEARIPSGAAVSFLRKPFTLASLVQALSHEPDAG
jgi:signal transduction histidine kinase/CheY-like chemotaxis protein